VVVSASCTREDIQVAMVVKKHEIEAALFAEKQQINSGHLKEDNPLDTSDAFRIFCEACRR
jgi:ankyrin repeat/BTB/POZ domain-containing protein 1